MNHGFTRHQEDAEEEATNRFCYRPRREISPEPDLPRSATINPRRRFGQGRGQGQGTINPSGDSSETMKMMNLHIPFFSAFHQASLARRWF